MGADGRGDPGTSAAPSLLAALRRAVDRAATGRIGVSILFSGGIDSSLLARLFAERLPTDLVCVGFPKSPDVETARVTAELLQLPITIQLLSDLHIEDALGRWHEKLGSASRQSRSVALATSLALAVAPESTVAIGQGADELFYGYAHFVGLTPRAARDVSIEDLGRLTTEDWPIARGIAISLGKELVAPYLDPEVVRLAQSIPVEEHLSGGRRKPILREMARLAGLPTEVVERPKRAFQYGSRVDAALRRRARKPRLA